MNRDFRWNFKAAVGMRALVMVFIAMAACCSRAAVVPGVSYFVDPGWTGASQGTANAPWKSLDDTTWPTLNSALAVTNVTVYFTARTPQADVPAVSSARLNIKRTNPSPFWLTLDGSSMYNTSASSPSWAVYAGTNQHTLSNTIPVTTFNQAPNPPLTRSNIVLHGFLLLGITKSCELGNVNNMTVEQCELTMTSGANGGPCFQIDPIQAVTNLNGQYWSQNVIIRSNYIHDTCGEGIYINGQKDYPSAGMPTGTNITIEYNTICRAGARGAQGDGIDVKDGWRNIIIRYNTSYSNGLDIQGGFGMVIDSGVQCYGNFVWGNCEGGISLSTVFAAYSTRANSAVYDNIVIGNGMPPLTTWQYGIEVRGAGNGQDNWTNLMIANNTVAFNTSGGISVDPANNSHPTVHIWNNIIWSNMNSQAYQLFINKPEMLLTHGNNLVGQPSNVWNLVHYGTMNYNKTANVQTFEPAAKSSDPQFFNPAPPFQPNNFRLLPTSPAISAGMPSTYFAADFFQRTWSTNVWDMGAIHFRHSPPTNLHITQ